MRPLLNHTGCVPVGNRIARGSNITYIKDWHHECMRLIALGWTNVKIARHLGVVPESVNRVRYSPITRRQIDAMHAVRSLRVMTVESKLEALASPAVDEIKKALESEVVHPKDRANIAFKVLDYTGRAPAKKLDVESRSVVFGADDLQKLIERRNAARAEGLITDAVVEEAV